VVEYGETLAGILSADNEIVELSAYLHDIAAVCDIRLLAQHNTLSADFAKRILSGKNYPLEKTERIMQAIRTHTSPVQIDAGSAEEICISNADAMSQITMPAYWFYFIFSVRKLPFEQGRLWLQERIESNWGHLIQPAREIIQEDYNLVKSILYR
jgi:uncharacterized protein